MAVGRPRSTMGSPSTTPRPNAASGLTTLRVKSAWMSKPLVLPEKTTITAKRGAIRWFFSMGPKQSQGRPPFTPTFLNPNLFHILSQNTRAWWYERNLCPSPEALS